MRVLSYNILNPDFAIKYGNRQGVIEDGQSNWPHRKQDLACNIRAFGPDIVCVQEASYDTIESLVDSLQKPFKVAVYSEHTGTKLTAKYGNAIIVDTNKITIDHIETIKTAGSQFSKSGAFAKLKEKESDITLAAMSVHLRGYSYDQTDANASDHVPCGSEISLVR